MSNSRFLVFWIIIVFSTSGCVSLNLDDLKIGNDEKQDYSYNGLDNLSQVLHCLAIVNGAKGTDGDPDLPVEIACPQKLAAELEPIYFEPGSTRVRGGRSIEVLAFLLNSKAAQGVTFQLNGHSDSKGSLEKKRRNSYNRAKSLRSTLIRQGVSKGRIRIQGRSDSAYPIATDCINGKSSNRCNDRVSIEVVTPLVARVGRLPGDRKQSSIIGPQVSPPVRHFPRGLSPGQPYSTNLRSFDLPDFDPQWNQACQGQVGEWVKLAPTNSLFDRHAGSLWTRVRFREEVDKISWFKRTNSKATVLLEFAGSKDKPKHETKISGFSLPDYWAVRQRIELAEVSVLKPIFESFRSQIQRNQASADCDSKGGIGYALDCPGQDHHLRNHDAANSCLSSLLDEEGGINPLTLAKVESEVSSQLPMHGDDKLAHSFGVNTWAASTRLMPGMELCIGETTYGHQEKTGVRIAIDDNRLGCQPLRRVRRGGESKAAFSTWVTDMQNLYPNFRGVTPRSKDKNQIEVCVDTSSSSGCRFFEVRERNPAMKFCVGGTCEAVQLVTYPFGNAVDPLCEGVANSSRGVGRIGSAEQLGCIEPASVVLLFPNVIPEGGNVPLAKSHIIATAESVADMDAFIESIETAGNNSKGLFRLCQKVKEVMCVEIRAKKATTSRDILRELYPRLRVIIGSVEDDGVRDEIPLGTRLEGLLATAGASEAMATNPGSLIYQQLNAEFGAQTVIEYSVQLLEQWPVTALRKSK